MSEIEENPLSLSEESIILSNNKKEVQEAFPNHVVEEMNTKANPILPPETEVEQIQKKSEVEDSSHHAGYEELSAVVNPQSSSTTESDITKEVQAVDGHQVPEKAEDVNKDTNTIKCLVEEKDVHSDTNFIELPQMLPMPNIIQVSEPNPNQSQLERIRTNCEVINYETEVEQLQKKSEVEDSSHHAGYEELSADVNSQSSSTTESDITKEVQAVDGHQVPEEAEDVNKDTNTIKCLVEEKEVHSDTNFIELPQMLPMPNIIQVSKPNPNQSQLERIRTNCEVINSETEVEQLQKKSEVEDSSHHAGYEELSADVNSQSSSTTESDITKEVQAVDGHQVPEEAEDVNKDTNTIKCLVEEKEVHSDTNFIELPQMLPMPNIIQVSKPNPNQSQLERIRTNCEVINSETEVEQLQKKSEVEDSSHHAGYEEPSAVVNPQSSSTTQSDITKEVQSVDDHQVPEEAEDVNKDTNTIKCLVEEKEVHSDTNFIELPQMLPMPNIIQVSEPNPNQSQLERILTNCEVINSETEKFEVEDSSHHAGYEEPSAFVNPQSSSSIQSDITKEVQEVDNHQVLEEAEDVNKDTNSIDVAMASTTVFQAAGVNSNSTQQELLSNNPDPIENQSETKDRDSLETTNSDAANQNRIIKYQKNELILLKNSAASKVRPKYIPDVVLAADKESLMTGSSDDKINNKDSVSMKISHKIHEEVKLHECDNPWQPMFRIKKSILFAKDEELLLRKFRGILNKMVHQNYFKLLQKITSLSIKTETQLQGVVDLIFKKAVTEPVFCVIYANICGHLALLQVRNNNPQEKSIVNFRKLLLIKCEEEFDKQFADKKTNVAKIKEIEYRTDLEEKEDIQFDLQEYLRTVRMYSLATTKFLGELFKQNMLTQNIMMRYLNMLLHNRDDLSLECLCVLLTTIGKELDNNNVRLTHRLYTTIFEQIKRLANKKENINISSRIRFKLLDIIDLRNSKWVSNRQNLDNEVNSVPVARTKFGRYDRSSLSSMREWEEGRHSRNVNDDLSMNVSDKRAKNIFPVQYSKLNANKMHMEEELPGNSQMFFRKWQSGSTHEVSNTTNWYAASKNVEADEKMSIRSDSEFSDEQYVDYDSDSTPDVQLRNEKIINTLDDYISGSSNSEQLFTETISSLVTECYIHVLEKSSQARLKTGGLFAELIVQGKISTDDYCAGLENVLSKLDDTPNWDSYAEILVDLICEEALPLKDLHRCMKILIKQEQADQLLAPLFKLVIKNNGSDFLENQWNMSELQLSDFMNKSQVDSFITDNRFEFMSGEPL